jgi:hypothetical protein
MVKQMHVPILFPLQFPFRLDLFCVGEGTVLSLFMMIEDEPVDIPTWNAEYNARVVQRSEELVLGTRPRPTLDYCLRFGEHDLVLARDHAVAVTGVYCTHRGIVACFVDGAGAAREPSDTEFEMWLDFRVSGLP